VRVVLLGGTGSIGRHVMAKLISDGHEVIALARSDASAERLAVAGAHPLVGDMRTPGKWIGKLPAVDGVIHAASDFADDMGQVETALLDALLPALGAMPRRPRFVYTGGCWLFGATGDRVAVEDSSFDPLPADRWAVDNLERILASPDVDGTIIHPAMVYSDEGGVFSSFMDALREGRPVEVIGSQDVVWPLVHAEDLAALYLLVLEHAAPGAVYNGSAIDGMTVGGIVRELAKLEGVAPPEIRVVDVDQVAVSMGEWARGYALSQRLSGGKAQAELGWMPAHRDAASLF
jgi:nucleoside-diphosphate-sugar epimerase